MATAFVKKIDGHVVLELTPEAVAELALTPNSSVELESSVSGLVIQPYRRRKYKLSELLADFDQMPRDAEEDRIWLNSPPVGRELL